MSRGNWGILWRFSRGQRGRYVAATAAMLLATVLVYLPPLVVRDAVDGLIAGRGAARMLLAAGLAIIGLTVIASVLTYYRGRWIAVASERITRDLRDHLYARLHHLPCSFHDKAETGDLVQRCTSDVEMIRMLLSTQLVELGRAAVMVAAALPIMAWLDWRMTLAATCLLPVIVVFAVVFFIVVRGSFLRVEETEGALTTTLQENLTGIRVVRAFARQEFEYEKFEKRNADHRAAHMHLYKVLAGYWAASDVLVFAQSGLVLFLGAHYAHTGRISPGTWVAFQAFVLLYIWPVRQMGRILAELGKTVVSLQRVGYILHAEVEESERSTLNVQRSTSKSEEPRGALEFRDVHFSHGDSPVLRGVSFTAEPGQTVGILGPSGSGKSTIIHLLLRFYDYTGGSITLDGRELRDLPRKWVRSQMGVVMQEPFLYSRSLRENIALGRKGVGDEEIFEASSAAAVHETIQRFGEGYDTVIGERGVTLSGGQRQRVALARALLRRPPILLLDDAFSAVDTRTEAMILRALRQRRGKQTTLVIAHRLTTLMHADKVLVMEHGRVSQQGTHAELIQADGLYRRLWELQKSESQISNSKSEISDFKPENPA